MSALALRRAALSAADAAQFVEEGWYQASALAAFEGADETELSFADGEALLVSGDERAPEGWRVAARHAEPSVQGLVPANYLLPYDFVVTAPVAFSGVSVGDLPFSFSFP